MLHVRVCASAGDSPRRVGTALDTVINSPARRYRSAEDMSRLAPVTDGAVWRDRTNWDNTYISYYTWGAAIGLGLDLSLRARSDNKLTLDDYMRALWRRHGEPRAPAEGIVARALHDAGLRKIGSRGVWRSGVRRRIFRSLHPGA